MIFSDFFRDKKWFLEQWVIAVKAKKEKHTSFLCSRKEKAVKAKARVGMQRIFRLEQKSNCKIGKLIFCIIDNIELNERTVGMKRLHVHNGTETAYWNLCIHIGARRRTLLCKIKTLIIFCILNEYQVCNGLKNSSHPTDNETWRNTEYFNTEWYNIPMGFMNT